MRTVWALGLGVSLLLAGCSVWNPLSVRSKDSDAEEAPISGTRLVGDLAVPYGLHPIVVESVGFVSGLRGTGSDTPPSPHRNLMMREMQRRGVDKPNALLASSDTALVLVRALLRPGIQKGDVFDVEVRVPSNSETTSLRGGILWTTELNPLAVMPDSRLHRGHALASAKGPIMVDPGAAASGDRILSAVGEFLEEAIPINPGRSCWCSSRNTSHPQQRIRRSSTAGSTRSTMATRSGWPRQTDEMIELKIHSRYHDNIERYIRVVRAIPCGIGIGARPAWLSSKNSSSIRSSSRAAINWRPSAARASKSSNGARLSDRSPFLRGRDARLPR